MLPSLFVYVYVCVCVCVRVSDHAYITLFPDGVGALRDIGLCAGRGEDAGGRILRNRGRGHQCRGCGCAWCRA